MPSATLEPMRPWMAAFLLAEMQFVKAGYDPKAGVERTLKAQAVAEGDKIRGFETAEEQLRMLADMPEADQIAFLATMLDDLEKGMELVEQLAKAWIEGDTDTIARLAEDEMKREAPKVYQKLIVQRNIAWSEKIAAMLKGSGVQSDRRRRRAPRRPGQRPGAAGEARDQGGAVLKEMTKSECECRNNDEARNRKSAVATALCRRVSSRAARPRRQSAATTAPALLVPHLVIQPAREQPADAEHIHRGAEGAVAEAVFALAEFSRAMIHGDFDEAIPGAFHQRGNEAVHAFEGQERADAFASHRLQRAAGIPDAVFRETAPDEIRDAAGDALDDGVLALRAIAANEIGAALDLGEQISECRRDRFANRRRSAPRRRRARPAGRHTSPRSGRRCARICTSRTRGSSAIRSHGLIARAVIDENDFVIEAARAPHSARPAGSGRSLLR